MNTTLKAHRVEGILSSCYLPFILFFLALLAAYLPTFTFEYMFGDDYNEFYAGGSLTWMMAHTGRPLRYLITQFTASIFRASPEIISLSNCVFLFRSIVLGLVVTLSTAFYFYFTRSGISKYYSFVLSLILFTTPAFIIKSSFFIYAVQYIALILVLVGFYFGFYRPKIKGDSPINGAVLATICYALSLSIYQAMIFYVGALFILFLLYFKATNVSAYRIHIFSFGVQVICAYLIYELATVLVLQFYGLEKIGRYADGFHSLFAKSTLLFSTDFSINFAYWVYAEGWMEGWAIFVIFLVIFMAIHRICEKRKRLRSKEVMEKVAYIAGFLSFASLSYLVQPRINYSQTGPAMCTTLIIFIYAINHFWNRFIAKHIPVGGEFLKPALALFVAVICLISANAAVSSIAFQGALELAFIKAELARHENKEITKIVQVVPFLKKWRTPELCKNTPCKGEFSWKMTSLVDGAIRQLEFVRNLLCGQDEICSERPLKIMRVLMPPAKVEANTAIVDMRPLYDMYKRVAEEH